MCHEMRDIVFETGFDCIVGVELKSIGWQWRAVSADVETCPSEEVEFAAVIVILYSSTTEESSRESDILHSYQSKGQIFSIHVVVPGK
jgi:hypothetical protein